MQKGKKGGWERENIKDRGGGGGAEGRKGTQNIGWDRGKEADQVEGARKMMDEGWIKDM